MEDRMARDLAVVNFSEILNYKKPVVRCYHGDKPINQCIGFCHDCEDKRLPDKAGKVVRMSHGCTSADFISIIGSPLPVEKCALPIMFLLENPGGDYDLGEDCMCDGIVKQPPTKQFYFSSGMGKWPNDVDEIGSNHYGDYFAYLMVKHGLSNVYITNCVKCKYEGASYWRTADNCMARYLTTEIDVFRPKLIVCFSTKVSDKLFYKRIECSERGCSTTKVCLLHPSADCRPKWRGNWRGIVKENDRRLEKALRNLVVNELLRVDVVDELYTSSGEQWSAEDKCSMDGNCENSGVRYSPQNGVKPLPTGVELYCVFNKNCFHGCEIAAWQKDGKRMIHIVASSEEEKSEWHISSCGNWLAWKGIYDDHIGDRGKNGYGMIWDNSFFHRIQNEPEYKKHMVKELADAILKLYEMLTA